MQRSERAERASASSARIATRPPASDSAASSSAAAPSATACAIRSIVGVRTLPEIARQALREQEAGVAGREQRRTIDGGQRSTVSSAVQPEPAGAASQSVAERAMRGEEPRAPHHPRAPVRARQDVEEALGPLEVGDQDDGRERR